MLNSASIDTWTPLLPFQLQFTVQVHFSIAIYSARKSFNGKLQEQAKFSRETYKNNLHLQCTVQAQFLGQFKRNLKEFTCAHTSVSTGHQMSSSLVNWI
jgi:hypothetical protein